MPAVAVRRIRLVLFIFSRYKGYLDGKLSYDRTNLLELHAKGLKSTNGVEIKC